MINVGKVEAKKKYNNDEETWDASCEYSKGLEALA